MLDTTEKGDAKILRCPTTIWRTIERESAQDHVRLDAGTHQPFRRQQSPRGLFRLRELAEPRQRQMHERRGDIAFPHLFDRPPRMRERQFIDGTTLGDREHCLEAQFVGRRGASALARLWLPSAGRFIRYLTDGEAPTIIIRVSA